MERTYTKQQFLEMVKDYLRSFNNPAHTVADGLTLKDCEILGLIDLAVKERPASTPILGARVGKIYPRTQAA